ncbi:hypothetical protein BASA60_000879 [Batrachochytrium salamandrivorans]|nr:hypothetical protein BASA60_000879 [Batrachochytrium salamandrivorans]
MQNGMINSWVVLGTMMDRRPIVSLELTENNEGPLQEPDLPNKDKICDDLEEKLQGFYDDIRARNTIVCYGAPDLYKIIEADMGMMVGNGKSDVETEVTEVAQKSDENEARKSTDMREEEWFRLYFKYKTELEQLRQDLTVFLEQHFEAWVQFLRKDCLTTKDRRFSPETLFDELVLNQPSLLQLACLYFYGQLVSRVESYKYLGVLIDSKLDHSAWLKQRNGLHSSTPSRHFTQCWLTPANGELPISHILCSGPWVKPIMGLSWWWQQVTHLAPLQTTINKGIRLFTGAPTLDCHRTPSG